MSSDTTDSPLRLIIVRDFYGTEVAYLYEDSPMMDAFPFISLLQPETSTSKGKTTEASAPTTSSFSGMEVSAAALQQAAYAQHFYQQMALQQLLLRQMSMQQETAASPTTPVSNMHPLLASLQSNFLSRMASSQSSPFFSPNTSSPSFLPSHTFLPSPIVSPPSSDGDASSSSSSASSLASSLTSTDVKPLLMSTEVKPSFASSLSSPEVKPSVTSSWTSTEVKPSVTSTWTSTEVKPSVSDAFTTSAAAAMPIQVTTPTAPRAATLQDIQMLLPSNAKLVFMNATLTQGGDNPTTSSATVIIPTVAVAASESPSTSNEPARVASSTSKEAEDEDEEMYIDVEGTEDKISGKNRRRAHIEFYRKLKSMRGREKKLQCVQCDNVVLNNDHDIIEHIQEHAGGMSYRCMMCGWEASQKSVIYSHMKERHPKKPGSFVDRRDMEKFATILMDCFPRNGSRNKIGLNQIVDKMIKTSEEKSLTSVRCDLCHLDLMANKKAVMRHMHAHPTFRCKACRYTSDTREQQEEHCKTMHAIEEAKPTVHFNTCTAADALIRILQKCFSNYIN